MASFIRDMWQSTNTVLAILAYTSSIPAHHTIVPPLTHCRIFTSSLYQGNCGSCAAFAVATVVSMQSCLYRNEDFIPSPYRIFDCSNSTCNSGMSVPNAAAIVNFGVSDIAMSEHAYGLPCDLQAEHRRPRIVVSGLRIKNAQQIKTAILWFGPLTGFMRMPGGRNSKTGVYFADSSQQDDDDPLDIHAMVLVGWDEDGNWIVQNSWGNQWGDGMGRGRISPGLLLHATDPTVLLVFRAYFGILYVCLIVLVISCFQTPNTQRRDGGSCV